MKGILVTNPFSVPLQVEINTLEEEAASKGREVDFLQKQVDRLRSEGEVLGQKVTEIAKPAERSGGCRSSIAVISQSWSFWRRVLGLQTPKNHPKRRKHPKTLHCTKTL